MKCKHEWEKLRVPKEDKGCGFDEVWQCKKCGFYHPMLSDLKKFFLKKVLEV